jgi:hypothetical protein
MKRVRRKRRKLKKRLRLCLTNSFCIGDLRICLNLLRMMLRKPRN